MRTLAIGLLVATVAAVQSPFTEERGTLPDGTEFLMRVPSSWNKILVRDLDFASGANNARNTYLLGQGYALSGTRRHRLRAYQYDPAREIANLDLVRDRFVARFGKPARVIQFGCSGGGHVSLAVAENFSEGIDGVIAMGAHTPVWLMNTYLDGWFALKTLIGADLPITDFPNGEWGPSGHGSTGPLPGQWRQAIDGAQRTPEGRARIALAFTIGQWPAWVNSLTPQPKLEDVAALQHAMYHAVYQNASNPGGEARIMFENAANGQQLSWNTGVDYREFFENGNEYFKQAVRQLYKDAGLDLESEIKKINGASRVAPSPHALDWWKAPGRTVRGNPRIPILRLHEIGDYQIPVSMVQGYETQVRANGKADLFRVAYVNADSHCGINAAETAAAFDTLNRRLDTGKWTSTGPDDMNTLAGSFATGVTPRFTPIEKYLQRKYNRVWLPEAGTQTSSHGPQ